MTKFIEFFLIFLVVFVQKVGRDTLQSLKSLLYLTFSAKENKVLTDLHLQAHAADTNFIVVLTVRKLGAEIVG